MNKEIRLFIRDYVKAIKESNAAIFAGAGLSKPAGYVNWKELLEEIAEDLSLDIDRETDLISLAQYHVNDRGNRNKINQLLLDEFTKDTEVTENHRLLARLPIRTYWTTNYDPLIETALREAGKRADVKRAAEDLTTTARGRDAIVYKMHGDSTQPTLAVLTKDDYEIYSATKRKMYTTALQGDLIGKTFLFLGFSFDDPNLQYVLSRIRILLEQDQREHYCFMKKIARDDFGDGETGDDDYRYAEIKQQLRVKDLKRYGIQVLLVDAYSQITEVLQAIEEKLKRDVVFVSGSASDYGEKGQVRVFLFAHNLSKRLISEDFNIVSGFGLGVGSCVLAGALEQIYSTSGATVEERLRLRPFPQATAGQKSLQELWTQYRKDMLSDVGVSIYIFGNKFDKETGQTVDANGMWEEFLIGQEAGVIPIPIGATGFTARKIWEEVMSNFTKYIPDENLVPFYRFIGDESKSDDEILEKVLELLKRLRSQSGA